MERRQVFKKTNGFSPLEVLGDKKKDFLVAQKVPWYHGQFGSSQILDRRSQMMIIFHWQMADGR